MQENLNSHFIKNIEIKNFKCFEDFKAEGFGHVNLIGGKNNVGKTALLEAIGINVHTKDVLTLFTAISTITFQRNKLEENNLNRVEENFENLIEYNSKTNLNQIGYRLKNQDGKKEYSFQINEKKVDINSNEFSYQIKKVDNIYFIDNFGFDNLWLNEVYIAVQKKDKEEALYEYINEFDSSIEKFKIFDNSPECKRKGSKNYRKINEFGSGLKYYISIICGLYACENGYLFIDEIDNGIHHSKLDKLWNIILIIAKEQNVQVFATTHSKECIKALVTANTEDVKTYQPKEKILDNEEIKFIELGRTKGKVDSIVFDFDELKNEVEQNMEIRGW